MYVFFKVSIHVQQTTQLKHYAAYNTEEGRRQTNGKRQRNAKINGRGIRKWIGTAGSPGTGSRKKLSNFWKQTFIQVYKYIQPCLSKIYRFWKRKKEKGNRNEIQMRRIKKEECRHRGLLKQKRITETECKGKEQKRKCKKWEMQKWHTNAEKEWRKICRIQI